MSIKTIISQKYFLFIILFIVIFIALIVSGKKIFKLLLRINTGKSKSWMIPDNERARQAMMMLKEFDRKMEKMQIKRPLHLTLTEFADFLNEKEIDEETLNQCREFLQTYCRIRYEKEKIEESDLKNLKEKLSMVRA